MPIKLEVCSCSKHAQLVSENGKDSFHFTTQMECSLFLRELMLGGHVNFWEKKRLLDELKTSPIPETPLQTEPAILWNGTTRAFEALVKRRPCTSLESVHDFLHTEVPHGATRPMRRQIPVQPGVQYAGLGFFPAPGYAEEVKNVTPVELLQVTQDRYKWMDFLYTAKKLGV